MSEPMTADRPTTVAEAVEAGARAVAGAQGVPFVGPKQRKIITAVLAAVGYAALLAEVERLAECWEYACARANRSSDRAYQAEAERDALAATVARTQEALRRVRSIGAISGTNLNSWNAAFVVIDAALHPREGSRP